MGLSNLPPGVTDSMIDNMFNEGAWEALIDDIYATKVPYMVNGKQKGEILITPEEARERWESQPKLKEFYDRIKNILIKQSGAIDYKYYIPNDKDTDDMYCEIIRFIKEFES